MVKDCFGKEFSSVAEMCKDWGITQSLYKAKMQEGIPQETILVENGKVKKRRKRICGCMKVMEYGYYDMERKCHYYIAECLEISCRERDVLTIAEMKEHFCEEAERRFFEWLERDRIGQSQLEKLL